MSPAACGSNPVSAVGNTARSTLFGSACACAGVAAATHERRRDGEPTRTIHSSFSTSAAIDSGVSFGA